VAFSLYSPNLYQKERRIVALYRNRRSHGNIIAWSNRYFYEDTMRDYGNSYITFHLVHSDVLPKKGFPVVFHSVKGSEQHAEWSPSYFNIIEASIVRDYCVKLTGDTERKICEYGTMFWSYLHFLLFFST
jgi:helicase MOV-10